MQHSPTPGERRLQPRRQKIRKQGKSDETDNLHVRLNFNLSKEKGIKQLKGTYMKLVKLQSLVANLFENDTFAATI
jgi:hypothetical protein